VDYTDEAVAEMPQQIFFYRARAELVSGQTVYSNTIELLRSQPESGEVAVLTVYPNPVQAGQQVFVRYNAIEETNLTIGLYDITGKRLWERKVLSPKGQSIIQIPTNSLTAGVYNVSAQDGETLRSFKIIIMR
jgi:outer membrane protein assembly factor BamB